MILRDRNFLNSIVFISSTIHCSQQNSFDSSLSLNMAYNAAGRHATEYLKNYQRLEIYHKPPISMHVAPTKQQKLLGESKPPQNKAKINSHESMCLLISAAKFLDCYSKHANTQSSLSLIALSQPSFTHSNATTSFKSADVPMQSNSKPSQAKKSKQVRYDTVTMNKARPPKYICRICDQNFPTINHFRSHLGWHNQRHDTIENFKIK